MAPTFTMDARGRVNLDTTCPICPGGCAGTGHPPHSHDGTVCLTCGGQGRVLPAGATVIRPRELEAGAVVPTFPAGIIVRTEGDGGKA